MTDDETNASKGGTGMTNDETNATPAETAIELRAKSVSWRAKADAVAIKDQESYDFAAEMVKGIAALKKQIVDHHADSKSKTHDAWKAVIAAEKKMLAPIEEADGIVRGKLSQWLREQERVRREQEERRLAEARKREEEIRINTAIQAEKIGAPEETIAEILEQKEPVTVARQEPTFKPTSGVSGRKSWKYKVVDEGKIPREYLAVNHQAIGAVVRAMGAMTKIAGIEVYEDFGVSVRG